MSDGILVLNQNYIPINVTNKRRAAILLYLDKAHAINETGSIVRLNNQIKRPAPEVFPSRKAILSRDNFTCVYCGVKASQLTLDHVIPKSRGGKSSWDNLVCSCVSCNNKKDDKTPEEAGLILRNKPKKPKCLSYMSYAKFAYASKREDWSEFLEPYLSSN